MRSPVACFVSPMIMTPSCTTCRWWITGSKLGAYTPPTALLWNTPGNNELVTLWLVAPFSGDFLYGLTNLPAAVLLACATVEIGRQIGLSTTWRNLSALAVVTNYVVLRQLITVENDVAVAALFVASLNYTLRYADHRCFADLLLGVVCLGLLAGVKYYALGYAAVAAFTAAMHIARRQGWRAATHAAVWGLLGLLAFGGYWYIRNWIAGGSPLYPLGLTAATDELGPVYPGSLWATTFIGNGRSELPELAIEAVWGMTGPCQLAALLGLPVTLGWLVVSGFFGAAGRSAPGSLWLWRQCVPLSSCS